MALNRPIINAVKEHAYANYNKGGWDFLVECWSDQEIADCIRGATNSEEAIERCANVVNLLDERRTEVRAEIW